MVNRNVHGDGHYHPEPDRVAPMNAPTIPQGETIVSLFCFGNKIRKVTIVGSALNENEKVMNLIYDFIENDEIVPAKGNRHAS
jgi:hypothetical protein